MSHLQNISRIKAVHNALEELAAEVVLLVVQLFRYMPTAPQAKAGQQMMWIF
jgi:hypothetical protein